MKRYIRAKFEIDESKFNEGQLEIIREGLESGVDVSIYADPKFNRGQMNEIRQGLEDGLDVSIYAHPEFDWEQMYEILEGLRDGLDVSIYAYPKFDWAQMYEIRKGLRDGLDVSIYADPKFNWKQMQKIRLDASGERVKLQTQPKRRTNWSKLQEQIENDLEYCDPLYEDTEAGSMLNSIVQSIEDKLNIYVEPSIQGGVGGIWIYDIKTDETLVEDYDYQSFNEVIIDICLDSKNKTEFQKKVKAFYEDLIER